MWVLVIGSSAILQRDDGGLSVLKELGCRVKSHDLWDDLDEPAFLDQPPAAILVEALDQFDAGRAALMRIRAVATLAEVPSLVAVTVGQAQRLDGNEAKKIRREWEDLKRKAEAFVSGCERGKFVEGQK